MTAVTIAATAATIAALYMGISAAKDGRVLEAAILMPAAGVLLAIACCY